MSCVTAMIILVFFFMPLNFFYIFYVEGALSTVTDSEKFKRGPNMVMEGGGGHAGVTTHSVAYVW